MLNIQKYLTEGKTLDDLNVELGITSTKHPDLPLVILNYSQINSPKTHPIVRECRGLVLEENSWEIAAKSMSRFFNWGEVTEEMELFDFSDFSALSKEDGSLILLFNYKGQWFANTRNSFGQGIINFTDMSWHQLICKALKVGSLDELKLDPSLTYVCELCSLHNKVVRTYPSPVLYLITAFQGKEELKDVSDIKGFLRPEKFKFSNIQEIIDFLQIKGDNDPTFEGVVIRDSSDRRYKAKNPKYISLHHLRGEGDNLFNPKYLLPFIFDNEGGELLSIFPEVKEKFYDCKGRVENSYDTLLNLWRKSWQIQDQKEFALSIVGKTPFTGILFNLRKTHGNQQTEDLLNKTWRNSTDTILKILFKG